jgi:hypothetical protein
MSAIIALCVCQCISSVIFSRACRSIVFLRCCLHAQRLEHQLHNMMVEALGSQQALDLCKALRAIRPSGALAMLMPELAPGASLDGGCVLNVDIHGSCLCALFLLTWKRYMCRCRSR